jgi:hypothetical protein
MIERVMELGVKDSGSRPKKYEILNGTQLPLVVGFFDIPH